MQRYNHGPARADGSGGTFNVRIGSSFALIALALLGMMATYRALTDARARKVPTAGEDADETQTLEALRATELEIRGRIEVLQELESRLRTADARQIVALYERLYEKVLEPFNLTEVERKVALATITGDTNAAIAERLHISESTVKHHLSSVFKKTGTDSRQELHARASRALTAATGASRNDQSSEMMR